MLKRILLLIFALCLFVVPAIPKSDPLQNCLDNAQALYDENIANCNGSPSCAIFEMNLLAMGQQVCHDLYDTKEVADKR